MTVSRREVNVIVQPDSKIYGTQDDTNYKGYTLGSTPLVDGEEINVTIYRDGIGSDLGKYDNVGTYVDSLSATVTSKDGSLNMENYIFPIIPADYVIQNAQLEVGGFDANSENQSKTYDGETLYFNPEDIVTSLDGVDVTTSVKYFELNEDGSFAKEITLEEVQATDVVDSKSYGVRIEAENFEAYETTFEMTIEKRQVEIQVNEDSKVYGTQDDTNYEGYTVGSTPLVDGEEIDVEIYRNGIGSDLGKYDNVGTYEGKLSATISPKGVSLDMNNYTFTVNDANYTIENAQLEVGGFDANSENQSKTYDGETLFFNPEDITTSLDGVDVSIDSVKYYELNDDGSFGKEITLEEVQATNVADSKSYGIRIEAENFEAYETTFQLNVLRRPVTISIANTTLTYGSVLNEVQLQNIMKDAINNATTSENGKAIIDEGDLNAITSGVSRDVYHILGWNDDVVYISFSNGEIVVIPLNGIENTNINNNYAVTVLYGDLLIEEEEITNPTNPNITYPTTQPQVEGEVLENDTEEKSEEVIVDDVLTEENDVEDREVIDNIVTSEKTWSLFNLIATIIAALAAVILIVMSRKKEDEQQIEKRRKVTFVISIITSVVSIVLFVLTQDMTQTMITFDMYSIYFAILLILSIIVYVIPKQKEEKEAE